MLADALDQALNAVYDPVSSIQVLGRLIPDLLEFLRMLRSQSRQPHTRAGHTRRALAAQEKICRRAECAKHENLLPILIHVHSCPPRPPNNITGGARDVCPDT